jgi:hypothetical protein
VTSGGLYWLQFKRPDPMIFRQASDLTTRQQVWVSSLSATGKGFTAAQLGGAYADTWAEDARFSQTLNQIADLVFGA